MKKLMTQILKFGAVGILCFLIDYGVMIALVELAGVDKLIASGCSFTISVIVNYILSITVVFDADRDSNKLQQFVIFVVLSAIGLGINQLIMWKGDAWLGRYMGQYQKYAYMVVKIFATGVVMVYNFITRKIFIEKKPQKA